MTDQDKKTYLCIGSAKDLRGFERIIYRLLEIIPGALVWFTFAAIVWGSIFRPLETVFFIIAFDIYWLLKTVYLSWHLRASFRKMQELLKIDWVKKLDVLDLSGNSLGIRNWRKDLWHLLILPYYKEGYEVLETSLQGISNVDYPKDRIMVVLSGEERAGEEARRIGEKIQQKFGKTFGRFIFTIHKDAPGELAGKGANETWAAREAKEKLIDEMRIPHEHVIMSVYDADTVPSKHYFSRLAYCYLTAEKPLRTSFQPVPLFINNIWEAPLISRVLAFSSTFWHLMNQMRPEQLISFSSHAFPFKPLAEFGFWQVNVVSEDSRIFWQALLAFDGDWRVEPLLIPVSMDANVGDTAWQTLKNLYLQQRRWAYGVADVPYAIYGFIKNPAIRFRTKIYWVLHRLEAFWSWPTNSIMIFITGWLPLLLGGGFFGTTVLAHNVPRITRWILTFAMLGIITSIYLTIRLLPPRPASVGARKYVAMVLQWFIIPISLVFSSIPAIEAEIRLLLGKYLGFWPTPKVRKGIQKEVF